MQLKLFHYLKYLIARKPYFKKADIIRYLYFIN